MSPGRVRENGAVSQTAGFSMRLRASLTRNNDVIQQVRACVRASLKGKRRSGATFRIEALRHELQGVGTQQERASLATAEAWHIIVITGKLGGKASFPHQTLGRSWNVCAMVPRARLTPITLQCTCTLLSPMVAYSHGRVKDQITASGARRGGPRTLHDKLPVLQAGQYVILAGEA